MHTVKQITTLRSRLFSVTLGVALLLASQLLGADAIVKSQPFKGPKANTGHVTLAREDGKLVLTLSADFETPDTPDPHWQVVDSKGTVFLLQRIAIKENKMNRKIVLPAYVKDVAKVVIWCAWAESNLGEAVFDSPAM